MDADPPEGAGQKRREEAAEAASEWLSLPWELLHDEGGYLLHGASPAPVRRRLPNRKQQPVRLSQPPVRILLLSPRPEVDDDGDPVAYIDHRASALPLVAAVENLGELAHVTVLTPPTLPALEAELARARAAGHGYDAVHFDGHGVYDKHVGLGALLFEHPGDAGKPGPRRLQLVDAEKLAAVMRDHGIPLVFLEACQTAQVETDPTASVAARLLSEGVSAVAAMRASVLVETSRRFVEAFYRTLAQGQTVGEAMLAGQQALEADADRGAIMGAGRLRLHDWFVPVLYQEEADPPLFSLLPGKAAQHLQAQRRKLALSDLEKQLPPHQFVGRSRELLYPWHQIGMVHRSARQFEAAERAYRQALGIRVQHRLRSDEAASLNELGNLYDAWGRREEAVAFYRQAADIYTALGNQANEGRARNNIADTLRTLGRTGEARREILRAIECKQPYGHAALPWTSFAILHNIEQAAGNGAAAAAAWRQARDAYLAYRRDGGYAQTRTGDLCEMLLQAIQRREKAGAAQVIAQAGQHGWNRAFVLASTAIVDGNRNLALLDDPTLDYDDSAELRLLLERLS